MPSIKKSGPSNVNLQTAAIISAASAAGKFSPRRAWDASACRVDMAS
jgi:hypothetical protein